MSLLTRWTPFKQGGRLESTADFDDLFRGLGLRSMLRDFEPAPEIKLEVKENDGAYTVTADVPGVDKDDIDVTIEHNQVTISAESKREEETKDGERLVHSERYYGRAVRSFTLPYEIDEGKAKAAYDKGVLKLTLPKKSNGGSRRISVS